MQPGWNQSFWWICLESKFRSGTLWGRTSAIIYFNLESGDIAGNLITNIYNCYIVSIIYKIKTYLRVNKLLNADRFRFISGKRHWAKGLRWWSATHMSTTSDQSLNIKTPPDLARHSKTHSFTTCSWINFYEHQWQMVPLDKLQDIKIHINRKAFNISILDAY